MEVVLEGIARHPELDESALASLTAAVDLAPPLPSLRLVAPPTIEGRRQRRRPRQAAKRDYVLLEHSNIALGLAGELAVVRWERQTSLSPGGPISPNAWSM